jgi:hypothetical protein
MPFARGLANEELVLRRAAGMRTGVDDQLSAGSENALAAFNRVLDQLGCRQVLPEFDDLEFIRNGKNGVPPLA